MKKIISIMLALILNLNIALGYTSTILIKGVSLKVTGEEGSVVNIRSKLPEATGWEVKTNNTTVNANGEFVMPAGDVIIEAILPDALTYLLTVGNQYFDRRENKPAGEIVTVEADSSDGSFVFTDWTATGITLTAAQKVSQAITFTMPANAVTLIANYIEAGQEYTVTFDANGGSGTMEPQTFVVGTAQYLRQNTFTNTGKTFAGWSRDQNATINELTDGQSYNGTGNITLYAVWTTDAYTITYDLDGGIVSGNPGTYNVDTETITLNNPTKEGYTFLGWTGSNGNTPATTVTILKGSTGNKEYKANWQINNYTITFNKNDGTNTAITQEFGSNETKNLTLNTFTREGYNFKGWSTDSGATTATYTDGQSYTATGNVTLYAVWENLIYSVPVGAYIQYTPTQTSVDVELSYLPLTMNPSTYSKGWKVFKNNSGQIDIISAESIGSIYMQGKRAYFGLVGGLNDLCSAYVNTTYADKGRCLGFLEGSSMEVMDSTTYSVINRVTTFPYSDTFYEADISIINTEINGSYPLRSSDEYVFLAARNRIYSGVQVKSYAVLLSSTGGIGNGELHLYQTNVTTSAKDKDKSTSAGVRPVISLKSGLKITGGTGTASNPYIISN